MIDKLQLHELMDIDPAPARLDEDDGLQSKTVLMRKKMPNNPAPPIFDSVGAVVLGTDPRYVYLGTAPYYHWYFESGDPRATLDDAHRVPRDEVLAQFDVANKQQTAKFMQAVAKVRAERDKERAALAKAGQEIASLIRKRDEAAFLQAMHALLRKHDVQSGIGDPIFDQGGVTIEVWRPDAVRLMSLLGDLAAATSMRITHDLGGNPGTVTIGV